MSCRIFSRSLFWHQGLFRLIRMVHPVVSFAHARLPEVAWQAIRSPVSHRIRLFLALPLEMELLRILVVEPRFRQLLPKGHRGTADLLRHSALGHHELCGGSGPCENTEGNACVCRPSLAGADSRNGIGSLSEVWLISACAAAVSASCRSKILTLSCTVSGDSCVPFWYTGCAVSLSSSTALLALALLDDLGNLHCYASHCRCSTFRV